ncbi:MAG: hypothetical protein J6F31_08370 [Oscillospiraceae bacterium]|nr:hypothetical protein [Oscillospiraceae bacterium]
MKKNIVPAVITAFFLLIPSVFCAAAENKPEEDLMIVSFEPVTLPLGTAYIDILGKISPESEYYTENSEFVLEAVSAGSDGESTKTDAPSFPADSEISLYSEDGYMSLSRHYSGTSEVVLEINEMGLPAKEYFSFADKSGTIGGMSGIYKKFGRFKAAYVSAEGKVLGVTEAAESRLTDKEFSNLSVSGDTAVYEFYSENAANAKKLSDPVGLLSMAVFALFFIMLIALGVIVIRNIWRFIRQMQKKK